MFRSSISLQWSEENQGCVAVVPEPPEVSTVGDTPEVAVLEVKSVTKSYIESIKEDSLVVPKPQKIEFLKRENSPQKAAHAPRRACNSGATEKNIFEFRFLVILLNKGAEK